MQFLKLPSSTKLSELSSKVGKLNVNSVLALNGLTRKHDIGKQYADKCTEVYENDSDIDWQRKSTLLNTFSKDYDIFEKASLMGEDSWKVLSKMSSFPGMIKIPDSITIPESVDVIGNGQSVPKLIYNKVMNQLQTAPHIIDPSVFNTISVDMQASMRDAEYSENRNNVFQQFNIPWGDITLYSSMREQFVNIPVYPESVEDGVTANYSTMPDMLYQYEPWQVYQSSGPRQCSYEFHLHRDMWSGDHRDGKCNELIRFCQAQCYPSYSGSIINVATVKLYVKGNVLISGVLNDVKVSWSGPIGLDGWYLECTLTLTITEVSDTALNYDTVRSKGIIE